MVGKLRDGMLALAAAATIAVGGAGAAFAQMLGVPRPGQMNLPEPVTPTMERLTSLHDGLLILVTVITLFVMSLLLYVMVRFRESRNPNPSSTTHHTVLEVAWTVVPILILVFLCIPSFRLLYFMDRVEKPDMTIKAIGRQWYWTYEYPDQKIEPFDAYMIKEADWARFGPEEKARRPRLLAVDNEVVVPVDTTVRVLVTSTDVMHAWAVPSFGVKLDAIIGRVNETWFKVTKPGLYYGQCSQICGTGHAYMPIAVRVVSKAEFEQWVAKQKKTADAGAVAPAGTLAAAR